MIQEVQQRHHGVNAIAPEEAGKTAQGHRCYRGILPLKQRERVAVVVVVIAVVVVVVVVVE